MKKLYTLIAVLAAAMTASATPAQTLELKVNRNIESFDVAPKSFSTTLTRENKSQQSDLQPLAVPTGSWKSLGMGTWFEGIFSDMSSIEAGTSWQVEIEESETTAGYYRILPYNSNSPVVDLAGAPDTQNYWYINATNPDQVYLDGDAHPFGIFYVSQLTYENGWGTTYQKYGTLSEGNITFPSNSFAYSQNGQDGWGYINSQGAFKILLPGYEEKDYTLNVQASHCADNNMIQIALELGADIASLKCVILDGDYDVTYDANAQYVATYGQDVPTSYNSLNFTDDTPGLYTCMLVALNADGDIKAMANSQFYVMDDDSSNWEALNDKAQFTEGIYSSLFTDIDQATYDVDIEAHKTISGYYRLVNPYLNNPEFAKFANNPAVTHAGHNHYLFIDASDADHVIIEPSPLGVVIGYGSGLISSWAYFFTTAGMVDEGEKNGVYGTLTDNTITIPDNRLRLSLSGYDGGTPMNVGQGTKIVLPTDAAIDGIISDTDADAPVEYFNLQGIRVNNPENGIYIVRQGSKVSKVYKK